MVTNTTTTTATTGNSMGCIEEVAKKLCLWHTPTFRPLLTHDDLDPIMRYIGFQPSSTPAMSSPPSSQSLLTWREFTYIASHSAPRVVPYRLTKLTAAAPFTTTTTATERKPRLPSTKIDGLHLFAYKAFLDAVAFYIGPARTGEIFHVRAMPLTRTDDRSSDKSFRIMRNCAELEDDGMYVYRDGTLDQVTMICSSYNKDKDINSDMNTGPIGLINNYNSSCSQADSIFLVDMNDLFP